MYRHSVQAYASFRCFQSKTTMLFRGKPYHETTGISTVRIWLRDFLAVGFHIGHRFTYNLLDTVQSRCWGFVQPA